MEGEFCAVEIRAVTFDVGGTLVRPWPSVGEIYSDLARQYGLQASDADILNQNFRLAWEERRNFGYSIDEWELLVQDVFRLGKDLPPGFFRAVYRRFESPEVWRIFDDVMPILETFQRLEIPMAVISNWDERLHGLLKKLNLAPFFQATIASVDAGFQKPSLQIFRAAQEKLGLDSRHILHVGDSRAEDLDGAKGAGMEGLLLDRSGEGSGAEVIRDLREVERIVRESYKRAGGN